jgi:hypothetical protein
MVPMAQTTLRTGVRILVGTPAIKGTVARMRGSTPKFGKGRVKVDGYWVSTLSEAAEKVAKKPWALRWILSLQTELEER